MMKNIDVSIVIINFNTKDLTIACLQSIIEKTKGVSYEIILVDNASTEVSPEVFIEMFPQINLIQLSQNLGFAKGNNKGIEIAKGKVILLLNSDTVLVNDAISLTFEKLISNPSIGVITCKLLFPNGEIQHQARRFERISLRLLEMFRVHKLFSKAKRSNIFLNGYFDHLSEVYPDRIWGTFFMFKKEVLEMLPSNKWSEKFFMYGEDNEWCYQLKKYTKLKILYYPTAEIIHFLGGSKFGKTFSPEKNKIILQNKRTYMSEYYGVLKTRIYFFISGY